MVNTYVIKGNVKNQHISNFINYGPYEKTLYIDICDISKNIKFIHVKLDDIECIRMDFEIVNKLIIIRPDYRGIISVFYMKQIWDLVKPELINKMKRIYGNHVSVVFSHCNDMCIKSFMDYVDNITSSDIVDADLVPLFVSKGGCIKLMKFVKVAGLEEEYDDHMTKVVNMLKVSKINADNVAACICTLMNISYMTSNHTDVINMIMKRIENHITLNSLTDDDIEMISDHYHDVFMELYEHNMEYLFDKISADSGGLMSNILPLLAQPEVDDIR